MTRLALLIALVALLVGLVPTASAAPPPQDWQFAAVHCSGFDVPTVQSTFDKFSDWYGGYYNLNSTAAWQASYEARVNLYAHLVGCPDLLRDGQLTFAARVYAPVFQFLLDGRNQPF
jgi:hypothetical protein